MPKETGIGQHTSRLPAIRPAAEQQTEKHKNRNTGNWQRAALLL